jgi:sulfite reductase alpha subunit-like flavoprotein
LGDSGYTEFCFAGKKVHRRLEQLGAEVLVPRGDCDDRHSRGVYGVAGPWIERLWAALRDPSVSRSSADEILPLAQPVFAVSLGRSSLAAPPAVATAPVTDDASPPSSIHPFMARVSRNERLTDASWDQDVRLLGLDVSGSGMTWSPGDVLSILPRNRAEATTEFFRVVGLDPDEVVSSLGLSERLSTDGGLLGELCPGVRTSTSSDAAFAAEVSARLPMRLFDLFNDYYDIAGTMRRPFFEQLFHYLPAPEPDADEESEVEQHREKLREWSTDAGQEDLWLYNGKERRTCTEVFRDFGTIRPPVERLLEMIPRLQPREFSISSACVDVDGMASRNEIQLTLAVVDFTTPLGRRRVGVCSSWMASLPASEEPCVPVWLSQASSGSITLPPKTTTPLIMVGPGTGCAAFRSFLQYRHALALSETPPPMGAAAFYFGCRSEHKDFIHASEWNAFLRSGALSHFSTAFSRDVPEGSPRMYVTQRLVEDAELVWRLVCDGGIIFVSGSARTNMPRDVRAALVDIFQSPKGGAMPAAQAEETVRALEKRKRIVMETWF